MTAGSPLPLVLGAGNTHAAGGSPRWNPRGSYAGSTTRRERAPSRVLRATSTGVVLTPKRACPDSSL